MYVSNRALAQAVDHLQRGGVIALPTDTQYALSGVASNDDAVGNVFRLKRRPGGENLPVLLPPARWRAHLEQLAEPLNPRVITLAEVAWPGALTLIVTKRREWSTRAVDGGTIALRIPDHPIAAAVLDAVDQPLTGTSANLHGQPAALTAAEVREQFSEHLSTSAARETLHVLDDDGHMPAGTASTILDCTGHAPRVLRRGVVLEQNVGELLSELWGLVDLNDATSQSTASDS